MIYFYTAYFKVDGDPVYRFLRCHCGEYDSDELIWGSDRKYNCLKCKRELHKMYYHNIQNIKKYYGDDYYILDEEETEIYYKLKKL